MRSRSRNQYRKFVGIRAPMQEDENGTNPIDGFMVHRFGFPSRQSRFLHFHVPWCACSILLIAVFSDCTLVPVVCSDPLCLQACRREEGGSWHKLFGLGGGHDFDFPLLLLLRCLGLEGRTTR